MANMLFSLVLSLALCVHTVTSTSGTVTQIYKGCVDTGLCPSTGTKDFSVDVGTGNVLGRADCCDTNNCNAADAVAPTTPTAGTLQCNTFDPVTNTYSSVLSCNSLETRCFQTSVTVSGSTGNALGCSSLNLCESSVASLTPLLSGLGTINTTPSCCSTNNCNTPVTTAAPTTTTTTAPTTTTTTAPTTTTTTAPTTTTTAAPTTTTTTAPTTTTTTAPTTTTTTAPTTTTTAAPTTTTTTAPTTTTTTAPTTTTTTAPTTTTTAAPTTATTAAATTTTTAAPTTTASSAGSLPQLTLLSSLFGLIIVVLF
ncbi:hypothetical protein WMY93_012029 [Mugilogobius chulae]|uniref:Uncharacterized protein n=1 Tax=Mugilogobius chulae TaxID=88201 RepID=A0AAW0PGG7_9GOBI